MGLLTGDVQRMSVPPPIFSRFSRNLARIRCLEEALDKLHAESHISEPLSEALCYHPSLVRYQWNPAISDVSSISLHDSPDKNSQSQQVQLNQDTVFVARGKNTEVTAEDVIWLRISEIVDKPPILIFAEGQEKFAYFGPKNDFSTPPNFIAKPGKAESLALGLQEEISDWQEVVDIRYGLSLDGSVQNRKIVPALQEVVDKIRSPPGDNWTLKQDLELVRFLSEKSEAELNAGRFGRVTCFVDKIELSSSLQPESLAISHLTDDNPGTFWESDGQQNSHHIRLHIKQNIVVDQLFVTVDSSDDSYMPDVVEVWGGPDDQNLRLLQYNRLQIINSGEVCVLSGNCDKFKLIEIKVVECKEEGIDCRIYGLRLKPKYGTQTGDELDESVFGQPPAALGPFPSENLYWRAVLLRRLAKLLDGVLGVVIPESSASVGTHRRWLEKARLLLPLSHRRQGIIDSLLKQSQSKAHWSVPKLFINRRLAAETGVAQASVFRQLYDALRRDARNDVAIDYKWSAKHEQWWECKFVGEGVIDQGGGFRDSLCDLAEELCPSDPVAHPILPFFLRAPSRFAASNSEDSFVLNPSCEDWVGLKWVGQLMGACVRTREFLVLPLARFVWKQLIGQSVTWHQDYSSVDKDEVLFLRSLSECDEEEKFPKVLAHHRQSFTCARSDGHPTELCPDGAGQQLNWSNRQEFVKLVKQVRMGEADRQMAALREGLTSVVPESVLQLMTWREFELRVCGSPKISIEELKKSMHFEDVSSTDRRVRFLWTALERFSEDERSRFIRFVSGRRRLPTPIYICEEKSATSLDSLPESSTCSNTLYLPNYSSAEICEEKLRYAIYHCLAIDTDINPWDE